MKRALALAVVIVLFFLMLPMQSYAADSPTIQGATVNVKAGDAVNYPVTITGNPGLTGFMIYVSCDTNIFSVDYDDKSKSYEVTAGEDFESGSILCAKNGTKGWVITWYASAPVSSDGELFHLKLTAKETASAGEYPVKISYSKKNTLNGSYNTVTLNCTDGSVTIAPETGAFRIGDIQAVPGGDVNIPIYVDANPGIAACKLYIDCNPNLFTADYIGETLQCSVTAGAVAQGGQIICSRNGSKGYQVVWQANTDRLGSGLFFTLPLHAATTASCGDYAITLRLDANNLVNQSAEKVTATATSGTLHLKECLVENFQYSKADGVEFDLCVGENQSVCLICAIYSEQGRMLELKSLTQQGAFSGTRKFSFSQAGASVKLFTLNSQSFVPISAAIEQ